MKKIAFLFPGQGAQSVGMGKDIYENCEEAKSVYCKIKDWRGNKVIEYRSMKGSK